MNHVHLIGRLGADPVITPYSDDKQPANPDKPRRCRVQFDLAVDRARPHPKTGAVETDWLPVTLFHGPAALYAAAALSKGDRVAISGRIETGSYEAEAGQKRKTYRIVADEVIGLDPLRLATDQAARKGREAAQ